MCHVHDWKLLDCQNVTSPQSNLQIQQNLDHSPSIIIILFIETDKLKIHSGNIKDLE